MSESAPPSTGPSEADLRLLQTFDELGRIAVDETDPRRLGRQAAEVIKNGLNLAFVAVGLINVEAQRYEMLAAAADFPTGLPEGYSQPVSEGLIGRCIREGRPIYIEDVRREPGYLAVVPGVVTELVLPVKVAGRVIGILDCEARLEHSLRDHRVLLELVAGRLGIALENAQLLREREQALERSAGRAKQLELLNEISRVATGDLQLRPTLQRITDALARKFGWEFIACATVDELRGRFQCEALTTGRATGVYVGYGRELGSGVLGEVAATRRPILINDVRAHANYVETLPGALSELCVPVLLGGKLVALLNLESTRLAAFHDQLPLLETVAEQVAGAIASAQLYEEAQRRAKQLELLNEIARIATQDLRLGPMLQRITDALVRKFGWEFVACALIDAEQGRFRIAAFTTEKQTGITVGYGRELGSGVVGEVAATGRPLLLDDVHTHANYVDTFPGAQSELCVPVLYGGRTVAVLNLESTRLAEFHDQLPLLATVADQVAGAIASAQLYEEAHRRTGQLEMLSEISRAAMDTPDLQALLDRVVSYVQQRFSLEIVGLLLYDDATNELEFAAFAGKMEVDFKRGARWPAGKGILGRCVRSGEAQLLTDVHADPEYVSINPLVAAEYTLPIRSRGRLLGLLDLESPSAEVFSPENLLVLNTIVDQVAGAIARAQLYEQVKRHAGEMEMMSEVSRSALEADELSSLLNRITAFIQSRLSLSLTAIILLDEKAQQFELAAQASDIPLSVAVGARWPVGSGIIGRAVRSGEPQLVRDVRADPDYIALNPAVAAEYTVPIRFQGRILGVMNFESTDAALFSPNHLLLLRTFVDQVAGAIHLAAVNQRVTDANRTLTDLFSRYVAPDLAAALLTDPTRFENRGERRDVSVMFADIRGFTSLSQRLGSEQSLALLNEYYTAMGEVIFTQRGSINRFLGDGLMAVFGVPEKLPGHTGAAVRAALGMQRAVDVLGPRWQAVAGEPLRIVIAINAGEVTAGNIGDPRHMEFTVLGDVVNVASRLETEAKARDCRILVTAAVFKTLSTDVNASPLGEIELRGRTGGVPIYKLM